MSLLRLDSRFGLRPFRLSCDLKQTGSICCGWRSQTHGALIKNCNDAYLWQTHGDLRVLRL